MFVCRIVRKHVYKSVYNGYNAKCRVKINVSHSLRFRSVLIDGQLTILGRGVVDPPFYRIRILLSTGSGFSFLPDPDPPFYWIRILLSTRAGYSIHPDPGAGRLVKSIILLLLVFA